jgi:hypothetical protein
VALTGCALALADVPPPYRAAGPLPEPALFGEGVVSTGEYESHPAFTPAIHWKEGRPAWAEFVKRLGKR